MKRLLALLSAVALLLTVMGGCTAPTLEEPTEPATEKVDAADAAAFDKATHNLALALACGLHTAVDPAVINSPAVLWDVIGWYGAISGESTMGESDVDAILYALRPGENALPIPTRYETDGKITRQSRDEEDCYDFEVYADTYESVFLNTYDYTVTDFSADTVKVVLTAKADSSEKSFLFSFQKDENAYRRFPYVLSSAILPASDENSEAAVTYEKLYAANTVTALLRKYSTMGISSRYADGSTRQQYYFSKNGVICSTAKNTAEDGYKTYCGSFGNFGFDETEERCVADICLCENSKDYAFDYETAGLFVPGTVFDLRETDDSYTFFIRPDFTGEAVAASAAEVTVPETTEAETTSFETTEVAEFDAAEAESAEEAAVEEATTEPEETTVPHTDNEIMKDDIYFTVDKNTLALKKAVWHIGTGDECSLEMEYGCEINDFQLTDHWQELREITFVCSVKDDDGAMYEEVFKYAVPGDLELIPYAADDLTMYNTPDKTEEYAYPGDDESYIVYVTV